jgi:hypothetical protein
MNQLDRIEAKLDDLTQAMATLIGALADDGEEGPQMDLDGTEFAGERDQTRPL